MKATSWKFRGKKRLLGNRNWFKHLCTYQEATGSSSSNIQIEKVVDLGYNWITVGLVPAMAAVRDSRAAFVLNEARDSYDRFY